MESIFKSSKIRIVFNLILFEIFDNLSFLT